MNLFCLVPNVLDATSLYRAIGPLQTLTRTMPLKLVINQTLDWSLMKGIDAMFLQRPSAPMHLDAMKLAKLNKKKIWIDYDDNLHAVPLCNRRYITYGHPTVQHLISTMIAMADVVTVTTTALAATFTDILKNWPIKSDEYNLDPTKIVIIPNAYDGDIMPSLTETKAPREKLVVWRGSDSHCKDLMLETDAIGAAMKAHPDWTFEFIGEPFWWTIEKLKDIAIPNQLVITPPMDPIQYFNYLNKQRPALVIVPLEDQMFNRAKSNIAWLEGAAAGAVTLAPSWWEWTQPGVITYQPREFGAQLNKFLYGGFNGGELYDWSRQHILEHLTLESTNGIRQDILRDLE